jgi:hypothetical protein
MKSPELDRGKYPSWGTARMHRPSCTLVDTRSADALGLQYSRVCTRAKAELGHHRVQQLLGGGLDAAEARQVARTHLRIAENLAPLEAWTAPFSDLVAPFALLPPELTS